MVLYLRLVGRLGGVRVVSREVRRSWSAPYRMSMLGMLEAGSGAEESSSKMSPELLSLVCLATFEFQEAVDGPLLYGLWLRRHLRLLAPRLTSSASSCMPAPFRFQARLRAACGAPSCIAY
jgi:hypothetical protein